MRKVILCSDVELEASAALALLADAPNTELLGIVAGAGRVTSEIAADSASRVLGCLGLNIPVVKGTGSPMVADLSAMRKAWELLPEQWPVFGPVPADVCGEKGGIVPGSCGVIWLIDTLMGAQDKITLLMLGPLTDLALALKIQPAITDHIERVIIVGGGHRYTDISAAAEFNIRYDPEAAAIVLGCAVPKYLIPLDCAYSSLISQDTIEGALQNTSVGALVLKLVQPLYRRYGKQNADGLSMGIPLPLLLGACFLWESAVLKDVIPYSVDVDFSGGYADGQTIFDTRRIFDDYNCLTTFTADRTAFLDVLHTLSAAR